MVQKLEGIKGGGGSIKVGTTGTISNLITRELESSIASSPQASNPHQDLKLSTGSVRKSTTDETNSSSSSSSIVGNIEKEKAHKSKHQGKGSHRVPMLAGDSVTLERTPSREKKSRKVINIVEVVDVKCGNPNSRAWATPLTTKLKKLGFSKLSEGMV